MFLLVGDLHLTDRPSDSYRFKIFNWIAKQQKKYDVTGTYLLGDLTDQKDRHSATLVNKIVSGLVSLQPPVFIVRGNHDYKADQSNPFFDFLNHIDGLTFATEPMVVQQSVALIPHYRSQDEFDAAIRGTAGHGPSCYLVHQTFEGAIAESGVRLNGLSASPIESLKPRLGVYAGDVHRPQTQGIVTYVGCPYQVRFGDAFNPRALLLGIQGGKTKELYFDAPFKWSLCVRNASNLFNNPDLAANDQVKITIQLAREETVEWKQIKQGVLDACKELKLEVHGVKMEVKTVTPKKRIAVQAAASKAEILKQFCKAENVASDFRKAGARMLGETTDDN